MSEHDDPRPWWASEPGQAGTHDDDHDPLTQHRRARAGTDDAAAAPVPSWWGPAAEAVARLSEDLAGTAAANAGAARGHRAWHETPGEEHPHDDASSAGQAAAGSGQPGTRRAPADDHRPPADGDAAAHLDVCGICPICVGLRALGTHRPELIAHLTEAARHLAAAVRSVVDASADTAAAPSSDPAGGSRRPGDRDAAGADDGLTAIALDELGEDPGDDLDDLGGAGGDGGPGGDRRD